MRTVNICVFFLRTAKSLDTCSTPMVKHCLYVQYILQPYKCPGVCLKVGIKVEVGALKGRSIFFKCRMAAVSVLPHVKEGGKPTVCKRSLDVMPRQKAENDPI